VDPALVKTDTRITESAIGSDSKREARSSRVSTPARVAQASIAMQAAIGPT
jgi:hypothetical protein